MIKDVQESSLTEIQSNLTLHVAYRPYIECPPSRGDTARCSPRYFLSHNPFEVFDDESLKFSVMKIEEVVIKFEETVIKTSKRMTAIEARFPDLKFSVIKFEVFSEGLY